MLFVVVAAAALTGAFAPRLSIWTRSYIVLLATLLLPPLLISPSWDIFAVAALLAACEWFWFS
jgi:hypothetical protein